MSQEKQNWDRFVADNVLTRFEQMRKGQKHTDDGPKKQHAFMNILFGAFFGGVLGAFPGIIGGVFVLEAHGLDNMVGSLWGGLLVAGGVAAGMVWGPFQYKCGYGDGAADASRELLRQFHEWESKNNDHIEHLRDLLAERTAELKAAQKK